MAWLAVDKDSLEEYIYEEKPERGDGCWFAQDGDNFYTDEGELYFEISDCVQLPIGTIRKILGHSLCWEDEPVEIQ